MIFSVKLQILKVVKLPGQFRIKTEEILLDLKIFFNLLGNILSRSFFSKRVKLFQ